MREPKPCCQCKWFLASDYDVPEGRCLDPNYRTFDLIRGWRPSDAREVRRDATRCGLVGKHFTKREPVKHTFADYFMILLMAIMLGAFVFKVCYG